MSLLRILLVFCGHTPLTPMRLTPYRRESKQEINFTAIYRSVLESTWSRFGGVTDLYCSSRLYVTPKI